MICAKLTNGFGNNLFQLIAGKLLSEYLNDDLFFVEPYEGYYATDYIKQLNIATLLDSTTKNFHVVDDKTYPLAFRKKIKSDILLSGYFEDYRYFLPNRQRIKSWFPEIESRKNCLAVHIRTGDRLFMKNEFYSKPSAEAYKLAVEDFQFKNLYIVTDSPVWRNITKEELTSFKFHTNVPDVDRVPIEDSVKYFNSLVNTFGEYNIICEKRNVLEDFNFIRSCDNILFEHGTLSWWAAFLSDANKVGVYGPWRPWKGSSNKNLSNVPLEGWFKWE
tara:strand:- start:472 stop:1296 length:825 start_codon:yes stop_codon:yes gene_type:complete